VVQVEQYADLPAERRLFDTFLKALITRATSLIGGDDDEKRELFRLGTLIAKLANYTYPKLATIHQVNEDMNKFIERMGSEFTVEDAKRALATQQRRLREAKRRPGRPPGSASPAPHQS
jgi:hypothetical protein